MVYYYYILIFYIIFFKIKLICLGILPFCGRLIRWLFRWLITKNLERYFVYRIPWNLHCVRQCGSVDFAVSVWKISRGLYEFNWYDGGRGKMIYSLVRCEERRIRCSLLRSESGERSRADVSADVSGLSVVPDSYGRKIELSARRGGGRFIDAKVSRI